MSSQPLMQDKVVVVTGAGAGIGQAIAVMMAEQGAKVVINDIGVSLTGEGGSATPAQETLALIEAAGGQAAISNDSVAEPASAAKIIQCALDSFGRIDAVVNNAGILRDVIFHKMTTDDWLSVINVHLNGSFFVSRAAAEHFRQQQSGAFVHMTSASGLVGGVGQANYASAKLGMTALSKSIALDMQRFNVRSNCIAPVAWSRMSHSIPAETPEQKERVERMQKITPAKNAPLAVYLASDRAAHVNGQVFGTRLNEIYLYAQTRLLRVVADSDGWTPGSVADRAMPSLVAGFHPLERAMDVFAWDPV